MAAGPPTPPIPSSAAPAPGTDYPLRLGDSFEPGRQQQGAGAVELYSFSYNFQPESVLNATAGLLITIKADQSADSRMLLVPDTPGQGECFYDGPAEACRADAGGTDCVAIFNGQEWVLDLVSARINSRHQRGRPSEIDVSGVLEDLRTSMAEESEEAHEQPAGIQDHAGSAAAAGQGPAAGASPAAHEAQDSPDGGAAQLPPAGTVDHALDAALDEALFSAQDEGEEEGSAGKVEGAEGAATAMTAHDVHATVEPTTAPAEGAEAMQEEEEEADDVWGMFDEPVQAAALPVVAEEPREGGAQHVGGPTGAPPDAATQVALPAAAVVLEEDEEDAIAADSGDDDSDGMGMEEF